MTAHLHPAVEQPLSSVSDGVIGCIYQQEDQLVAAVNALAERSVPFSAMRIGPSHNPAAQRVAQRTGIQPDLDGSDPLRGLAGLRAEGDSRMAVDRGGLLGAGIGALAGMAASLTPLRSLVPVAQGQALADILICFVLGAIVGSIWGSALCAQSSTHAGFRLIDGMQEGGLAIVVQAPRARMGEIEAMLQSAGGAGMTRA
ncbi:MAG: hypothetical protein DLM53_08580 [Candidatus Eremiobacter antarcticus]|nr:hypothetical protein [Candidatus Eremiobacteraeota bacterium]MBC5809116.1 hypothetical protein [Candidatus Eremiobacteraeota bacterium]PZR61630.1 MAG: hypothetical protein DLM53_08580 [Candidatus Eremiobacter sp. RRmetagenome_bin22]